MDTLLILKPNFQLLIKYGYAENTGIWNDSSEATADPTFIKLENLRNIPGTPRVVYDNLRMVCRSYGLSKLGDTIIYFCLDQADWYHSYLNTAYDTYHHRIAIKELATLLVEMQVLKDSELGKELKKGIELQVKLGAKVLARVAHPELLYFIKEALTNKLMSIGLAGGIAEAYPTNPAIDQLVALSTIKVKSPARLKNKLRTVFISKIQEFIAKETHIKSNVGSFTVEQRRLIYELGLYLDIFPEEHPGTESDYIEQIHRDNLKLFNKLAKEGRVNLF